MPSLFRPQKRFCFNELNSNRLLNLMNNTRIWGRNMFRQILRQQIMQTAIARNSCDLRIRIQTRRCPRQRWFYFLWKTLSYTGSRFEESGQDWATWEIHVSWIPFSKFSPTLHHWWIIWRRKLTAKNVSVVLGRCFLSIWENFIFNV